MLTSSGQAASLLAILNLCSAGDSFIAGFLYQYMKGAALEACLKQGATVASSVVQVFEPWVTD